MLADIAYLTVVLATIQAGYGRVAADSCFNIAYAPNGACNSDPKAVEYLQAVFVQDHGVPNCSDAGVFAVAAQFVDLTGTTSSVNAISPTTIGADFTGTMTFNFPIPIATIGDRSPVTLKLSATNPGVSGALTANIKYSQKHSPTVLFTTSTTATTVTAFSTATSTLTVTISGETTVTPSNQRTVTRFGIQTIPSPACTVLANFTVTPKVRTIIVTKKEMVTKSATCVPTQAPLAPTAKLRFKRDITYSTPYCGAPVTTVIPTSTLTRRITTTNVDIVTALSTSTLLRTETADSATVYLSVTSTRIFDAGVCKTKTAWIQANRGTSSVIKLATSTVYVYPTDGSLPVCGTPVIPPVTGRVFNIAQRKPTTSTSVGSGTTRRENESDATTSAVPTTTDRASITASSFAFRTDFIASFASLHNFTLAPAVSTTSFSLTTASTLLPMTSTNPSLSTVSASLPRSTTSFAFSTVSTSVPTPTTSFSLSTVSTSLSTASTSAFRGASADGNASARASASASAGAAVGANGGAEFRGSGSASGGKAK